MKMDGIRYLGPEVTRSLDEERKMVLVAGPRQVGKTTFTRRLLDEAGTPQLYFNWDVEEHRRLLTRHQEDFWTRRESAPSSGRPRIVLDEIHKFPRWKRFLKGLHDGHGAGLEILVTGSGRLDVFQRGGDSLFGRYNLYRLHPFTLGELASGYRNAPADPSQFWKSLEEPTAARNVQRLLDDLERLTGFPEPLFSGSESRFNRWRRSHRTLILREDLRDLTRIRDIGLLDSLAMLLPGKTGSPISMNGLAEDLGVNFGTVKNWLDAMSRLYFLFTVKPFSGKLARTLRVAPKVYLFDPTGIENPGAKFENLVALHLLKLVNAWTDRGEGEYELWYVRDREKREADFLITENRRPHALIEAKLSAGEIDPSLLYFKERLKPRYTLQVVRNPEGFSRTTTRSGVILSPAVEFLALI